MSEGESRFKTDMSLETLYTEIVHTMKDWDHSLKQALAVSCMLCHVGQGMSCRAIMSLTVYFTQVPSHDGTRICCAVCASTVVSCHVSCDAYTCLDW